LGIFHVPGQQTAFESILPENCYGDRRPQSLVDGQQVPSRPSGETVEELHPFVAGLLDLWRSKCPPGRVPRRTDLDVFTLQPWLGWLTVYEELDDGADFLVRLDGSNIVALTGDEWTGRRMSELDLGYAAPVLEALRRAVRERQPVVDHFYSPAVKDFLTFHRVTLPIWEDRRGVWQVIQGMHLAPGFESMGLYPARGRADQLWCRHPAGTFL
jgi:hypothetical protein